VTKENPTRTLPSRFVLAVTVGGVIGLGILRGPGEIAEVVSVPYLYLALWFFGGLFVLLSTAVSAELVGMTPRSGGFYSLIRRAYGPYPGFVIGWADWLTYAADLALKAVVIMEFVAMLFPETAAWRTPLAITVTTVFAAIQLRGLSLAALIQESATALIGLIIVVLSLVLFFVDAPGHGVTSPATADSSLRDWSLVIATIVFTYDGWLYASYLSGEIRGGAGAVARSCIKGMVIVIALYMLLNLALVKSVGLTRSRVGRTPGSQHGHRCCRHPDLAKSPEPRIHDRPAHTAGAGGGWFFDTESTGCGQRWQSGTRHPDHLAGFGRPYLSRWF
jgi:APA family basic amino acid/polyamine antiporter